MLRKMIYENMEKKLNIIKILCILKLFSQEK